MDIEEIRKNAPEGATHIDADLDYLKLYLGAWFVWVKLGKESYWQTIPTPDMDRHNIKPL